MEDEIHSKKHTSLFEKFGIPELSKKSLGRFFFDILIHVHRNFHDIILKKLDSFRENKPNWMTFYKLGFLKDEIFVGLNYLGFKVLLNHAKEHYKSMLSFSKSQNFNKEFLNVILLI